MEANFAQFQTLLHRALLEVGVKPDAASRFVRSKTEEELTTSPSPIAWVRSFFQERVRTNAKALGITLSDNPSPTTILLLADVEIAIARLATFDPAEAHHALDHRLELWVRSRCDWSRVDKEWMTALESKTTPGSFRPLSRGQGKAPTRLGFGSSRHRTHR